MHPSITPGRTDGTWMVTAVANGGIVPGQVGLDAVPLGAHT